MPNEETLETTSDPLPDLWDARGPEFVESQADVYCLHHGRTARLEDAVSWYPSEWDEMPPPGCYFHMEVRGEGIPVSDAIDLALEQSPLVILEALAGSGKTVTARALCQRRADMAYFDCASAKTLWLDVHNLMRERGKGTILMLDGFDDVALANLPSEAMRVKAMVTERGARAVITTRPFAVDSIPSLAGVPRVFLRSVADPAEPVWHRWLEAWNRYAPRHALDEGEIAGLQIEGLVAVPIMHQLFALTKDDMVARYRYDDELLDALSCDVLEAFFASHAMDWNDIALLPKAQMTMMGEIAWALHKKTNIDLDELTALCRDAGVRVAGAPELMKAFGHVLRHKDGRVHFRQRTFREYLTAWYWSELLSEMCRGAGEVEAIAESLGQAPLVRPGDRCLAFLARLTSDWPRDEQTSLVKSMVHCLAQRTGSPLFRYNLAWVLSAHHRLQRKFHWTIPDTDALRELLDTCQLPIALRGISLPEANLSGLVAPCSDLAHAELRGARLVAAKVEGASFTGADLTGADLSLADLRHVSFRDAHMHGCKLAKADLRGADLSGATLSEADFSGALYDERTLWPERHNPLTQRA